MINGVINLAEIVIKCPQCGGRLRVSLGQSIYGSRINYYEEHFCMDCGDALEVDACDTPESSRQLILQDLGAWEVVCKDKGTKLLKLLRKIFNYTLKEIADLKKQEIISFNGTFAEMELLKRLLESEKLQVDMKRIV